MSSAAETLETIASSGTSLLIAGKSYTLRRLGIRDVFSLTNLAREIYRKGADEVIYVTAGKEPLEALSLTLALGFTKVEDKVFELLADLLGVPVEDLQNPEKFPISSFITLLDAITKHPDLTAFFDGLKSSEGMLAKMFVPAEEAN